MNSLATEPATALLAVGSVVAGKFRIGGVLGDGASGVVYLAERLEQSALGEAPPQAAGERVALKVIHRSLARDPQISRRFHREARILRQLRGPNLVPLLDFGDTEDGLLYMALEYVPGQPLDVVVNQGRVSVERAVHIVTQICGALEDAHAAGIVHRDLKPGNVILESRDDREHVRVLDFGLAKAIRGDASQSLTALTQQNMVFGTPEYMAPEQARGDEVDARADVYATGIILYELLVGKVPFSGNNAIHVMTGHLTEEPVAPSAICPAISPALDSVVLHALSKHPAERYPSPAALAAALERALRFPTDVASTHPPPLDEDIGTRDTDVSLEPPPPPRRTRRVSVWFMIAVFAALAGIATGVALSLSN